MLLLSQRVLPSMSPAHSNLAMHKTSLGDPTHFRCLAHPPRNFRALPLHATAQYTPFPFEERDYNKVRVQVVPGHDDRPDQGALLFLRDDTHRPTNSPLSVLEEGMMVSVGGDTYSALVYHSQGRAVARPLSVELLWAVLQRGQQQAGQEWDILRVAVVARSDSAFIGRIFFGARESGQVAFDVDCRPSDAVWLALQAGAPIFIHADVWRTNATSLLQLQVGAEGAGGEERFPALPVPPQPDLLEHTTRVRGGDPELLKLLKRQLKVALQEEDYALASRIRDHPLMRLDVAALTAVHNGEFRAAAKYRARLRREFATVDFEFSQEFSEEA